jgi:hypothetical protein
MLRVAAAAESRALLGSDAEGDGTEARAMSLRDLLAILWAFLVGVWEQAWDEFVWGAPAL